MPMARRLSMTGYVEECILDSKEAAESGNSVATTVIEDTSNRSSRSEIRKEPLVDKSDDLHERRRRKFLDNHDDSTEKMDYDAIERLDFGATSKSFSQGSKGNRRSHSLFGSSVPHMNTFGVEMNYEAIKRMDCGSPAIPRSTRSRRHSLYTSSVPDLNFVGTGTIGSPSSSRQRKLSVSERSEAAYSISSEITGVSSRPSSARILSKNGPYSSLDDTIGKSSQLGPQSSCEKSVASESSQHSRRSMSSAATAPAHTGLVDSRNRIAVSQSGRSRPGISRHRSLEVEKLPARSLEAGRSPKPGLPRSRRHSLENTSDRSRRPRSRSFLGNMMGSVDDDEASHNNSSIGSISEKSEPFRRRSFLKILGGSQNSDKASGSPSGRKMSSDRRERSLHDFLSPRRPIPERRRSATTGSVIASPHSTTPMQYVNPHDLVNNARRKRELNEFSRNMLMDTIAKQVAQDLAVSLGTKCSPTDYHGNVGQGESIQMIHKTMMGQKGGTARSNLLSKRFEEIGIGIARGKDGQIYMCQLFK